MGAKIDVIQNAEYGGEPVGEIKITHSKLKGTSIDGSLVVRMIDEFPIFGVAAACAQGVSEVREASELRYKESDRISEMCNELRRLGVQIKEKSDGFIIYGNGVIPGGHEVDSHGDHRLAMGLTIAGLAAQQPLTVCGVEFISESYPNFRSDLEQLGANIRVGD